MSQITYEASVYTRVVKYRNFKGETNETTLFFALDPLQLMASIASFAPKKTKSRNPARQNETEITDEQQVKFVRDLAKQAAGFPSEDGETWEPFEDFDNTIAGKAFMTQLVSSDADRKEFAEKVILDPFRAFVGYAEADPTNTKAEIDNLKQMIGQLENVFKGLDANANESLEERRARLEAEIAALANPGSTDA
jgi:hypothetical protein